MYYRVRAHIYTHAHAYTHAHTHANAHKHAHTHTHARARTTYGDGSASYRDGFAGFFDTGLLPVLALLAVWAAPVNTRLTSLHHLACGSGQPGNSLLMELQAAGFDGDTRALRNALRRTTDPRVDEFLAQWTGERLGRMSTAGEQLLATASTRPDTVAIFQVEERQPTTMMMTASYCVLKIWCRRTNAPMLFKFDPASVLSQRSRAWSVHKHFVLDGNDDMPTDGQSSRGSHPQTDVSSSLRASQKLATGS